MTRKCTKSTKRVSWNTQLEETKVFARNTKVKAVPKHYLVPAAWNDAWKDQWCSASEPPSSILSKTVRPVLPESEDEEESEENLPLIERDGRPLNNDSSTELTAIMQKLTLRERQMTIISRMLKHMNEFYKCIHYVHLMVQHEYRCPLMQITYLTVQVNMSIEIALALTYIGAACDRCPDCRAIFATEIRDWLSVLTATAKQLLIHPLLNTAFDQLPNALQSVNRTTVTHWILAATDVGTTHPDAFRSFRNNSRQYPDHVVPMVHTYQLHYQQVMALFSLSSLSV
jgi:hypothetical protein